MGANKEIIFSDVSSKAWYHDLINRAYSAGVLRGYGDLKFGPNKGITREEAAAIISKHFSLSYNINGSELEKFSDAHYVGEWAREGLAQLIGIGAVKGIGDGSSYVLKPQKKVTRAEAVVIINRVAQCCNELSN